MSLVDWLLIFSHWEKILLAASVLHSDRLASMFPEKGVSLQFLSFRATYYLKVFLGQELRQQALGSHPRELRQAHYFTKALTSFDFVVFSMALFDLT